jgi:hypothetical protein
MPIPGVDDEDLELDMYGEPVTNDESDIAPARPIPVTPSVMPNTPRIPDDPREKIKEYLRKQEAQGQMPMSPDSRHAGRAPMEALQDNNRDLGLIGLFNSAANAAGTIGGKQASGGGLDKYLGQLQGQNAQTMQGINQDRQQVQSDEDRHLKIKQYMQRQGFLDEAAKTRTANEDRNFKQRQEKIDWDRAHPRDTGQAERKTAGDRKVLDQELKDLEARINPSGQRAGSMAKLNDKVLQAEAVEGLIFDENGQLKKDIDKRQIQELAKGLDNLLTSGVSTVSGVHELVPVSAQGNLQSLQEYITGIPTGGAMNDFVKKLAETVQREKAIRKDQLVKAQVSGLGVAANLRKLHPDEYWDTLNRHGLQKEDFDEGGMYIPKAKPAKKTETPPLPSAAGFKPLHEMTREEKLKELQELNGGQP